MQVTIIGGGSYQWAPKLITRPPQPSVAGRASTSCSRTSTRAPSRRWRPSPAWPTTSWAPSRRCRPPPTSAAPSRVPTSSSSPSPPAASTSMAVDLDVPGPARHPPVGRGQRGPRRDQPGAAQHPRARRHRPRHGGAVPRRVDAQHHEPDDLASRARCAARRVVKTVGLCHEVGGLLHGPRHRLRASPIPPCGPVIMGVNHFPVITEHRRRRRGRARAVGRIGGRARRPRCTRPDTGPRDAEPFSKLDFARRHLLKLTLLDRWGALPGADDRHLAEFLPSVLTEQSGWGATWGIELTPMSNREKHQDEYIAEVDDVLAGTRGAGHLGLGRAGGAGHRLARHRHPPRAPAQPAQHRPVPRPPR